ncbi:MAG TPA: ABC transporter permease [Gemmatimonadaceae bacterium]|nr:ABC transporter permease [Gemmatimonadaceae bacterium]
MQWLRWIRRRRRGQADFAAEVEAHLALEIDELVASGVPPDEARDRARRAFGNITRTTERFYDAHHAAWLETVLRNLRYAARTLRRSPGFTIAAVLTLAFGIGVNTAIFSFLYAFLLRPLPVRDAGRVVQVYREYGGRFQREVRGSVYLLSYPEFLAYRADARSFEGLAVYRPEELSLGGGGRPSAVEAQLVSCEYFRTLAVRMVAGRAFAPGECAHPGDGPVVVLSHALWQSRFGADPAIVGRTLLVNREPLTVVGVAEPGFGGITMRPAALWIPVTMHPRLTHGRDSILVHEASWLSVVGRLKPDVTIDAATAELTRIAWARDPEADRHRPTPIVRAGAYLSSPRGSESDRIVLFGIIGASGFVIVLTCANVMNLLLARTATRRREIGIRLALGAGRRQLVGQLLTESAVLAGLGGLAGLALTVWLPPLVARAIEGGELNVDFTLDLRILAYAFVASVVATLLFGLTPALQATRRLSGAIRDDAAVFGRRVAGARLRSGIVGLQVAGSAMLLVVAMLFVRSVSLARVIDPGFATEGVVVVSLDFERTGYDAARAAAVYRRLRERLAGMPGVRATALTSGMPLSGWSANSITADMRDPAAAPPDGWTPMHSVSAEYFTALDIPIVRGRVATDAEARIDGERPAVISATMARRYWPTLGAIGQRFHSGDQHWVVTGVAADVRNLSLDAVDRAYVYVAADPDRALWLDLVVRTDGATTAVLRAIPELVRQLDPQLVVDVYDYGDVLQRVLRPARLTAWLTTSVGALAALLALLGVYGVVSYSVAQRTRELGVRIALGAPRRAIVRLVVRQGLVVAGLGLLAGLGLAAGAAQLLRSTFHGIGPLDPVAYLGVGALLVVAAGLATLAPARRATRVHPAVTLRTD